MFHAIWEFCVAQSADSESIYRLRKSLRNLLQPSQPTALLHYDSHRANINKLQGHKVNKTVQYQCSSKKVS